ncbi:MAG: ornithine carbamoyltransferase [bacterium]
MSLKGKDLISAGDLSASDIGAILKLARRVKQEGGRSRGALVGRAFALYFEKPSLRTRVSFEVGIAQLGGRAIYLNKNTTHAERGETLPDAARVLSRYVDGIIFRANRHSAVNEMAACADVPVINALSDMEHPCQALTDIFTIFEKKGRRKKLKIAYIGDGNNVSNSLLWVCAKLGLHIALACPDGYEPDAAVLKKTRIAASESGGIIELHSAAEPAVRGADVIYTDVWVSMGQEAEMKARKKAFRRFKVDERLLNLAAPDAIFMHDMPAHRGEEVTAEVIDGDRSVVFDQAENRLYVQKAIMMMIFRR